MQVRIMAMTIIIRETIFRPPTDNQSGIISTLFHGVLADNGLANASQLAYYVGLLMCSQLTLGSIHSARRKPSSTRQHPIMRHETKKIWSWFLRDLYRLGAYLGLHAYKYISIRLPADRSNETPREATVSADQAVPYIDKVVDAHADTAQNVDV